MSNKKAFDSTSHIGSIMHSCPSFLMSVSFRLCNKAIKWDILESEKKSTIDSGIATTVRSCVTMNPSHAVSRCGERQQRRVSSYLNDIIHNRQKRKKTYRVARETIARQAISKGIDWRASESTRQAISKGIDWRASESTEAIEESLLRFNFLDDNDIISTKASSKRIHFHDKATEEHRNQHCVWELRIRRTW
jgi:hypothetical protein